MAIPVQTTHHTTHYENRHAVTPETNRAFVWSLLLIIALAVAAYAAYEVYNVQPTESAILLETSNPAVAQVDANMAASSNQEDTGSRTGPLPQ